MLTMLTAVDAQMIQDAGRYKMDLIRGLERTLHGKVKPSKRYPLLAIEMAKCTDPVHLRQ